MEQKYTNLENVMLSNCPVLYTNQPCYIITYNIKICLLFLGFCMNYKSLSKAKEDIKAEDNFFTLVRGK